MRNIKTKKNWTAVALLLALLLPMGVFAHGGLFQRGSIRESDQAISITNQYFGHFVDGEDVTNQPFGHFVNGDDITNQTFGTPLGSGLLIMLAASVCYATIKTKKKNH